MTRRERVRLYALVAPAVTALLSVVVLSTPSWVVGRAPPLNAQIELGLYVWVCAQIIMWIWYLRIRDSL